MIAIKYLKYVLKKILKIILVVVVLFVLYLLYVFAGIVITYKKQPEVTEEYQSGFNPEECYSETVSCDRACIVEDNVDALVERLCMIEQAKERVVLSTFEFRADESGTDVLASLYAAALRGVDIKIIIDGMSTSLGIERSKYFHALAALDNVEIRIYNKLNPLVPWKSMGRLHDKYVIIDDSMYILGGRNTYDFFLGDNGYKNYDRDVLVYNTEPGSRKSSLCQLEEYFNSVWELKDSKPIKGREGKHAISARAALKERYRLNKVKYPILSQTPDYEKKTFPVNKITLLTNPIHVYSKEPTLFYSLTELMKYSKGEDISIHTPYIICNDLMYDSLREICVANPDTRMLTNSVANNGNPFGASDYAKNKQKLLDTGLSIYEYEGGVSYHGKSIAVGSRMSIVGSFNMDMRSVYLDTELMLAIDSEGVNRQLRDNMRAYEASSVKALDGGNYEVPANVKRQELTKTRKARISLIKNFNWFRFLF